MKRIDICGVPVSAINIPMACKIIDGWIQSRMRSYICVAPVSTVVDSRARPEYRKVLHHAAMITPDGMPLVWVGKWRRNPHIERTYGPDLMLALCAQGQKKRYKHYLYGGTESTCSLLKNVLKNKFPSINIVGEYAPPFRPPHVLEDPKIIEEINHLGPDILWVGLGSPKQDYWMYEHRNLLNVPVMIGVGAAFDFIAGTKQQAPLWIRKIGMEWFFRLCCEPRRLWKRYLIGNAKFVYLLIESFVLGKDKK